MTREELFTRASGIMRSGLGYDEIDGRNQTAEEAAETIRVIRMTLVLAERAYEETFGLDELMLLLTGQQGALADEDREMEGLDQNANI